MPVRVVFMGSPEFALPTLRRLLESEHQVVAVYTQPDRPAGRGRALTPPPAKALALEHGVPVLQPESLRGPEEAARLRDLAPDLVVVAAYGLILPRSILEVPRHGCLNVHASLLPRHRGASPVAAAILAGDRETGVTIMRMDPGMDTGPVLAQRAVLIDPWDSAGTLSHRLASLGADLLLETIPAWVEGRARPQPQDGALATYCPKIRKEDGRIDWSATAETVWRLVRAYNPWPGAFTYHHGEQLRILAAWPLDAEAEEPPGTVVPVPDEEARIPGAPHEPPVFGVATGQGVLAVFQVQRAGRRVLSAAEFLRGQRDLLGARLG